MLGDRSNETAAVMLKLIDIITHLLYAFELIQVMGAIQYAAILKFVANQSIIWQTDIF